MMADELAEGLPWLLSHGRDGVALRLLEACARHDVL
jgi:hypothetical protein